MYYVKYIYNELHENIQIRQTWCSNYVYEMSDNHRQFFSTKDELIRRKLYTLLSDENVDNCDKINQMKLFNFEYRIFKIGFLLNLSHNNNNANSYICDVTLTCEYDCSRYDQINKNNQPHLLDIICSDVHIECDDKLLQELLYKNIIFFRATSLGCDVFIKVYNSFNSKNIIFNKHSCNGVNKIDIKLYCNIFNINLMKTNVNEIKLK